MCEIYGASGFVPECRRWPRCGYPAGAAFAHRQAAHRHATSAPCPLCSSDAPAFSFSFFSGKEVDPEQLCAGNAAAAGVQCLTGGQPEKQFM